MPRVPPAQPPDLATIHDSKLGKPYILEKLTTGRDSDHNHDDRRAERHRAQPARTRIQKDCSKGVALDHSSRALSLILGVTKGLFFNVFVVMLLILEPVV